MNATIGALVFAGGASSRMGTTKAWLSLAGQPLLLRVLHALEPVCKHRIVLARRNVSLPPLPSTVERLDDEAQTDGEGPLAAMHAGLLALQKHQCTLAVFAPCDAVFFSSEHVQTVCAPFVDPTVNATVPVEADEATHSNAVSMHPLLGAVRIEKALPALQHLLANGDRRARALFFQLSAAMLPATMLPEPRVLRPCNEPAQWQALKEEWERNRGGGAV